MADFENDDEARAFARSLVRAARGDLPTPGALRRVRRAMASGLAVGGAVGSASVTTAAAAPKLSFLTFSLAAAVKWGAIGVAAGGLTVGAAAQLSRAPQGSSVGIVARPRPAGPPATTPPATHLYEARRTDEAEDAVEAPTPAMVVSAAAPSDVLRPSPKQPVRLTAERPAPLTQRTSEPDRHEASSADDLASEVAMLEEVRSSLVERAPEKGLQAVERYRARWPNGRLALEATVLHIEALVQAGRRAQAVELAREFLAQHPRTPFARRVGALVGIQP